MTKLLNYLIIVIAGWLIISRFILGFHSYFGIAVNVIVGLAVIGLAFLSIKSKVVQWPSMIIVVLGIFLFLWGIVGRFLGASAGSNESVAGILLIILGVLVLPFQIAVTKCSMVNRTGGGLAEMTQIRMKDGNIIAKSILLGSMPETIYIKPEEICKAVALVDLDVILALPGLLYRGWKINRAQAEAKNGKQVTG
ncbi:hypothetical protein LPY66_08220 [Dehalobacter sp. DCM]|uniref:hypothetical protein n=1 Tax=Dehalobacter sp. DCM TaxID=2907827 RepID=UPI0030814418|nr:hypothetical protein LPY66_08220 [Dehalobacter sp. DCM]